MAESRLSHPPLSDEDWPEEIADMLSGFAGGLNVYRTMAHHPALLRAWTDLREHVVNQTSLGQILSEVVILRTGVRLDSSYEWHQHIVRARKAGLSDERIWCLKGDIDQIEAPDKLLAQAVDELFDAKQISEPTQSKLEAEIGTHGILDLMATVGFYSTLGFILNTFSTPLDDDIAADLSMRPLVVM